MDRGMNWEQRFIAELESSAPAGPSPDGPGLDGWLAALQQALPALALPAQGLQGALAQTIAAFNQDAASMVASWTPRQSEMAPALALAASFDAQMMLLVFGKFNAGKSSLCNFLAERYRRSGQPVQFFRLQTDGQFETIEQLQEGATETTRQLQGVRLGSRLVLLDTPGLHSDCSGNAALTQRFLESADGVLWLTSSTSPGQVQELDELGRELLRNKPLLPVITRSDLYEEDEVDGDIQKVLCNKTASNRALQEADVAARAAEKLAELGVDLAVLKPAVSISTHTAATQGQTPQAMAEAGFDHLYAALSAVGEPALRYKQRKPLEVRLHFLQEVVLGDMAQHVQPRLDALYTRAASLSRTLNELPGRIVQAAMRQLMPGVPELLEAPFVDADKLSAQVLAAFDTLARHFLPDFQLISRPALAWINVASSRSDPWHRYTELESRLHGQLQALEADALKQCRQGLERLEQGMAALQALLEQADADLAEQARAIRQ